MINTLELKQFRSYTNGLFEFQEGVNIIVGANASGKTNLLEAIHIVCQMHGFKIADKNMISYGKDWSRIEAMVTGGVRVVKIRSDSQNTIETDGLEKKRISENSRLPVVVFEPDHMLMLGGETERRRSYLDSILAQTVPGYKKQLTAYKRALSQRNRLLKNPNASQDQLFAWDLQLSDKAGHIISARLDLTNRLNNACQENYREISGSQESLSITYESKLDTKNYSESLLSYLRENIEADRLRGFTGAGPHRDDVLVVLKGKDARTNASRGETRSIILAMKIVELDIVHEHTGARPIFLLDDVFSELDGSRRRSLAEALSSYQTFITTTDADVVMEHFSKCNIIPVSAA